LCRWLLHNGSAFFQISASAAISGVNMMVRRPIRFNSPPLEVYTKIQSEVAERAQRGKKETAIGNQPRS
jgi:hypothetical protein